MRLIVQRVTDAMVRVNDEIIGQIGQGLAVLFGVKINDCEADADFLADKLVNLRIFSDDNGKMNLSMTDVGGKILVVPNFTLYGNAQKGRRPDFIQSEKFDRSNELFEYFKNKLSQYGIAVESGSFGADMRFSLTNDGPVTIIIHSQND